MDVMAWQELFESEFSVRLTQTLLYFIWQGSLIALIIGAVGWCLRGASARLRYAMNVAGLLVMATCVPVTFVLTDAPASERAFLINALPSVDVQAVDSDSESDRDVSPLAQPTALESDREPAPNDLRGTGQTLDLSASSVGRIKAGTDASLQWLSPYVAAAYLTGLATMLLKFVVGLWGGHRLRLHSTPIDDADLLQHLQRQSRRLGLRVAPAIAVCRRISVPIVIGIVRPVILLPASLATSLSPQELEVLLTHELAHVRRYDLLVNVFQRMIEAVLFFHPAVWYVSRQASIERERACDDFVVSAGWRKIEYAAALVRMAELCTASPSVAAASLSALGSDPSQFKLRIQRLLDSHDQSRLRLTRAGVLMIALLMTSVAVTPAVLRNLARAQSSAALKSVADRAVGESVKENDRDGRRTTAHDAVLPTPPKPGLRGQLPVQHVSLTHPPLWARKVWGKPDQLDWPSATGPLVLDDRRVLIGKSILDLRTGEEVERLKIDNLHPTYMQLSANRRYLLVCGALPQPSTVFLDYVPMVGQVWDVSTMKQIGTTISFYEVLQSPSAIITNADVSSDGKHVVTGSIKGAYLWDVTLGRKARDVPVPLRGYNYDAIKFSPDAQWLVVSSQNILSYWKWQAGVKPQTISVGRKITSLAFSPDSRYLAEGPGPRGDIQIRDMRTLELVRAVKDEVGSPLHIDTDAISFSSDGGTLIAGNAVLVDEAKLKIPHRIHFWDAKSGKLLHQISTPHHQVWALDITPDGRHIAGRLEDQQGSLVAVWSVEQVAATDDETRGRQINEKEAANRAKTREDTKRTQAAIAAITRNPRNRISYRDDDPAKAVRVEFNDPTDVALATVAHLPDLEVLTMRAGTLLTNAGLAHVANHPRLQYVNLLSSSSITDNGLKHLTTIPNLKGVLLYGDMLTDAGVEQFESCPNLEELYVGWKYSDKVLQHASKLEQLIRFHIYDVPVTDDSLVHLKELPNLKHLQILHGHELTGEGLNRLAELAQLKSLRLTGPFSDNDLRHLSSLVNVEELGLLHAAFEGNGLQHLKDLKRLQKLHLGYCNAFTNAGLEHLQQLESLQSLTLWETQVTDDGIDALTELKQLRELDISRTQISEQGVARLRSVLPELRIHWSKPVSQPQPAKEKAASDTSDEITDFEKGKSLVAAAHNLADLDQRDEKLRAASKHFQEFLKQYPKHELSRDARIEIADVLLRRGRTLNERAAAVDDSKPTGRDRRKFYQTGARDTLIAALAQLDKLRNEIEGELIAKPTDSVERKRLLDSRLRVRLLMGSDVEELAATYDPDNERHNKLLSDAAERFHAIYQEQRTRLFGLYARLYEGRCRQKLQQFDKASAIFDEILEQPAENEAFEALLKQTAELAEKCRREQRGASPNDEEGSKS